MGDSTALPPEDPTTPELTTTTTTATTTTATATTTATTTTATTFPGGLTTSASEFDGTTIAASGDTGPPWVIIGSCIAGAVVLIVILIFCCKKSRLCGNKNEPKPMRPFARLQRTFTNKFHSRDRGNEYVEKPSSPPGKQEVDETEVKTPGPVRAPGGGGLELEPRANDSAQPAERGSVQTYNDLIGSFTCINEDKPHLAEKVTVTKAPKREVDPRYANTKGENPGYANTGQSQDKPGYANTNGDKPGYVNTGDGNPGYTNTGDDQGIPGYVSMRSQEGRGEPNQENYISMNKDGVHHEQGYLEKERQKVGEGGYVNANDDPQQYYNVDGAQVAGGRAQQWYDPVLVTDSMYEDANAEPPSNGPQHEGDARWNVSVPAKDAVYEDADAEQPGYLPLGGDDDDYDGYQRNFMVGTAIAPRPPARHVTDVQ